MRPNGAKKTAPRRKNRYPVTFRRNRTNLRPSPPSPRPLVQSSPKWRRVHTSGRAAWFLHRYPDIPISRQPGVIDAAACARLECRLHLYPSPPF
jgi:hypothetical protein